MHSRFSARQARALPLILLLTAFPRVTEAQRDLQRELDAYIAQAQQTWPVPGLAVAIVKDGEVLLSRGYGVRRLGGTEPVDENTLFAIASNTKAFTAAALAMLVDEGRLSWDDRVIDHLPYFRVADAYATSEIRVRDLLTHRVGYRDYSGDLVWYGTPYSAEEVVRRVRYLPLSFSFRSTYGYSNMMFVAAGEVVHRVSGVPFAEFVSSRILRPLGMDRTTLDGRDFDRLGNVATPHRERDGRIVPLDWFEWDAADAAGGVVSSVHDMSRWLRLQLGRGSWSGVTLFSAERSSEMWASQMAIPISAATRQRYPSTHFRAYGLGWFLRDYLGRKVVMHGGAYDGMYSRVAMVPEENLGLVVLTNAMTSITNAITYRILDAFLGGEPRDWTKELLPAYLEDRAAFLSRQKEALRLAEDAPTAPARELTAYEGAFSDRMYGEVAVRREGDGLVLTMVPAPILVADLEHLNADTFRLTWRHDVAWFDGGVVQFLSDPQGRITGLRMDIPNEDFWFDELHLVRTTDAGTER